MGDFNIGIRQTSSESNKLDLFCGLFSLINVMKSDTYFTKFNSLAIELFLTNEILFKNMCY